MKVGLFPIDSKYHNLALMKLSTHHKKRGDETELYKPLFMKTYDVVYVSKIFTKFHINEYYMPEKNYWAGGSGFDLKSKLSKEVEHLMPDYSLYNLDYSLGFTTRGCNRNCKFCIVRKKEGKIKEHAEVEEFLNPESNIVILLDNNFLALPSHIKKLQLFIDRGWIMDFNQGLDIRLINEENAKLLRDVKHLKQIRFSWDLMNYEKEVKEGLKTLFKIGIKPYKLMIYILCNFDTSFEEDMYRFEELVNLDLDPFVMIYQDGNKKIRDFARWVNKRVYKVCDWEDYNRRTNNK